MKRTNHSAAMRLLCAVMRRYETDRRARVLIIPLVVISATSCAVLLGVTGAVVTGDVPAFSATAGASTCGTTPIGTPLCCSPSLTSHFLTATYATGTFYGLFCVNANGDGTYTQYSPGLPVTQQELTGTGHIRKNQGVTSIQAYMPTLKNLNFVGSTNGTASFFGESGSGFPPLSGTFTLS